jgi:hypothetical protein
LGLAAAATRLLAGVLPTTTASGALLAGVLPTAARFLARILSSAATGRLLTGVLTASAWFLLRLNTLVLIWTLVFPISHTSLLS